MTIKSTVEKYLKDDVRFRERHNKDRGIVNLLMRRYKHLDEIVRVGAITKDQLTEIVQDYASMDRAWRQALEHNPDLRGQDYDDKVMLEQQKQVKLGYMPGYHQDQQKLKNL